MSSRWGGVERLGFLRGTMNIGIEATSIEASQKAGVGSYTTHLLRALALHPSDAHTYTLYVRGNAPNVSHKLGITAEQGSHLKPKTLNCPYFWAQLRLPLELWKHPQDVYFFPSAVLPVAYQPEHSVVTIHDVAFLFFPECFSRTLRTWLTIATKQGIRRARKVIAVSEATRQDVLAYYDVAPEDVIAIHHGVHERFRIVEAPTVEAVKRKYQIDGPYLLYVGTLQRRKNIPRLLEAFARVKRTAQLPHTLVLVGQKYADLPEDEVFATIERLALQREVRWTGYVPDEDMPAVFTGADLFVLPSFYEGFGMPLLEAMACGVPVACSQTSSLPEVVGEGGLLFDPYRVDEIADALHRLLTDANLRHLLREEGLQRAATFSWTTCAQHTLDVLASVAKAKPGH
ncbi:glycosyltransferase [candidate division KSB3 bacterium]|uniref:Glycosyltransferase n=1 Tax=candidate division KSB3 bacterium TaxID=2044937 RepID=A0A9D5Q754_9BACT|nr:glycosyltransferase [candidate division KSB3 bacterium]MBD3325531.1 glycosyltransferase [candidate division KSB3 bacterium]